MAINVGNLVVEMSANVARLQADMNQARQAVERGAAGIASAATAARNALGALGVGLSAAAFASSIKSTVDFADHLNDLSQQLGISVKGLASWKLAADQSGTNLESIARAVKTLSTQMVDQSAKFKAAGITATDANGALIQLADVFARLPDGMQKTNLAVSLFGKAGLEMIPMLNQGSAGLAAVQEKARLYGERLAILAPEADKFNDLLAELNLQASATGTNIATHLIPAVNKFLETLNKVGLSGSISATLDRAIVGGNVQSRIQELQVALTEREKARATPGSMTGGGVLGALAGISDEGLRARIAGLKELAAQEALAGHAASYSNEGRRSSATEMKSAAESARILSSGIKGVATSGREMIDSLTKANGDAYIKFFTDMGKAEDDALFGAQELSKAQQSFLAIQDTPLWQSMPEHMKAWVIEQYRAVRANEELAEAEKERAKWEKELDDYRVKATADAAAEAEDLLAKAKAAEEENARIGLTAEQLGVLTAKRYDEQIALKRIALDQAKATEGREGEAYALEQQIVALERLKNAEVTRPKLQAQADAWQNFARDIESSLTDALMRSFESGESFGKTFAKTLQNTLKTMVLKFAVQMSVGGIMNAVGLGAYSSAAGGASLFGSAGNLVSTGAGLYQGYAGLTTGGGTGLWGQAGNWLGGQLGTYGTAGAANSVGALNYVNTMDSGATMVAANGTSSTAGALGGAATALGWMAAAYLALEYLDSKEGGVKTEGDSFATLTGSGATRGTSWVDGSPWYALGANKPQMFNLGAGVNEGDPLLTDVPGSEPMNDIIAGMLEPWTAGVRKMLADLGGDATGMMFGLGFNTDPAGSAPDNVSAGVADAAGNEVYRTTHDVDRGTSSAALSLELQRMMLAAVKAGDVQALYKDIVGSIDLATASTEQLTQVMTSLAAAQQLQTALVKLNAGFEDHLTKSMIDAAGGLDALAASASAYYDAYFTEAEKQAAAMASMTKTFSDLGLVMPTTRAGFRALVEGLDVTTEAGQKTFLSLMGLAPAFAEVTAAAEGLGGTLLDAVESALEGVERAVAAERDRLQTQYDAALASFDSRIAAVNDHVAALSDLVATLRGGISGINVTLGVTLAQRRAAQAEIISGAAIARAGGGLPGNQALSAALETFGQDATGLYASRTDYLRDQAQTLAALTGLADLTGGQLSIEQRMLDELQDSRQSTESAYRRELAVLDAQLAEAQNSVDVLKGIDTSVLSVAAAIEKLNAALRGGTTTSGGVSIAGAVADAGGASSGAVGTLGGFMAQYGGSNFGAMALRPDIAGLDPNAAGHWGWGTSPDGSQYWTWILDDVPAFASGGLHAGGLRIVGENGPELEATGPARYFNGAQMRSLMTGGDVAGELRALRTELAALRESNSAEGQAIAAATGKMARLLDRVMPDGDALAVRTAT